MMWIQHSEGMMCLVMVNINKWWICLYRAIAQCFRNFVPILSIPIAFEEVSDDISS